VSWARARVVADPCPARHTTRRLFFDEDALTNWLGEVLTDAEKVRLDEFLHEPVARQPQAPAR